MSSTSLHALILGASGISGWAILNRARSYPSPQTFSRITGTTNRPLSLEKAQIPPDPRIKLVSGIDLTKSVDEVCEVLKDKIQEIDTVTHVFFTGAFLAPGALQLNLAMLTQYQPTSPWEAFSASKKSTTTSDYRHHSNRPALGRPPGGHPPDRGKGLRARVPRQGSNHTSPQGIHAPDPKTLVRQHLLLHPIRHPALPFAG